jgi:membrane fusion protein (multidrug efflux system)
VGGGGYGVHSWRWSQGHAVTDDAYVQTQLAYVSPRVSGTILGVFVRDNQQVKPGDLLARLDPTDFQVAVARAQAALELAGSNVAEQEAAVRSAAAKLRLSEAQMAQAGLDYGRSENLFREGVIARQRLDRDQTALRVAEAQAASDRQELAKTEAALGGKGDGGRPLVKERKAALEQARLDLSYCEVRSPINGWVTRKQAEVGNYARAGQPLLALVPTGGLWVEANFKETQLGTLKPGQSAEVHLDAYPGQVFKGRVESIMAGTGAAMSLLPPENATGNWIKIVQRVPVKVVLEADPSQLPPLRVGQSAVVTVTLAP